MVKRLRAPEIPLEEGTLVIGDLHLDVEDGPSLEPFLEWLTGLERVPRLVILGDLFEYWFGPTQLRAEGAQRVAAGLRELVERGTPVDLIPGNRDFLLDAAFEAQSGARVCPEALVGHGATGERVLFLHGDELCTRDTGHLRLRRVLRAPLTRWIARHLPTAVADDLARRLRRASREHRGRKTADRVEMVPQACREHARRARAAVLVCGHAHRHRDEALAGGPRWLVVDDYGGALDTVEVGAGGALRLRASGVRGQRREGAAWRPAGGAG